MTRIKTSKPVIYDGDMGGDDLWAIAMLLAHADRFEILGVSTVFGNVSQPQAALNARNFLHWLGKDMIEVVEGANQPCDNLRPFGDDAYGENGVGGIVLPTAPAKPPQVDIADWLAHRLSASPEKVTIFATGPATNLALMVQKCPHALKNIEEIIFMGGSIDAVGRNGAPVYENGVRRIGNITLYAEFNAYQDPKALNLLIQAGAPLTFMAADATQHMVLTPERQQAIKSLHDTYGPVLHKMLMAVEPLDRAKFGVDGPFIHDPNVVTYALKPELYKSRQIENLYFQEEDPHGQQGDRRGMSTLNGHSTSKCQWLEGVHDTGAVFTLMLESLRTMIESAPASPAPLEG